MGEGLAAGGPSAGPMGLGAPVSEWAGEWASPEDTVPAAAHKRRQDGRDPLGAPWPGGRRGSSTGCGVRTPRCSALTPRLLSRRPGRGPVCRAGAREQWPRLGRSLVTHRRPGAPQCGGGPNAPQLPRLCLPAPRTAGLAALGARAGGRGRPGAPGEQEAREAPPSRPAAQHPEAPASPTEPLGQWPPAAPSKGPRRDEAGVWPARTRAP